MIRKTRRTTTFGAWTTAPEIGPSETYACSGNGDELDDFPGDHFAEARALSGMLKFTNRGVRARRTFTGVIQWEGDHDVPTGPGSETDAYGGSVSWDFELAKSGGLKLAPSGH